ncbi:MAG: HAD hydrolase family protein [Phycisphaerales bacterium]|nr:HAD hydrolase family protein [Phycisphaerales bacterium]
MRTPRYDIIALDLDGTLLGPDGRVSEANRRAVDDARAAGVEVVICTGRGFVESGTAIDAIDARRPARGRDIAPMVCAGGAMVVDALSGHTLHRWAMREDLVHRLCAHFAAAGRAPLILKDREAAGFDYLFVRSGPMEYPTKWWFSVMDVIVRQVDHISEDQHPEHTVRVGFAAVAGDMLSLAESVHAEFGRETVTQHFAAVAGTAKSGPHGSKDESVHLLEVFDPQVSKWTAVHRLALEQGVARERVAAVGDEVNDVALIEGAGLGIAMGNAVPAVRAAADRHTLSNAEDGVAHAIDRILAGEW